MKEYIKLTQDLPLVKKHGCTNGREYEVTRYSKGVFFFIGDTGEECGALMRECDYQEREE